MPCGIIHQIVWGPSVNSLALILKTINLFLPCKLIFWKATKVGSPPNFLKLISQLRWIPQPQYLVPSLLDPRWTYLWKHYVHHKKDTKLGSQILATKFGFVPDCSGHRLKRAYLFPSQRERKAELWCFVVSLTKMWNSRVAGDLRRHGAHVTSL